MVHAWKACVGQPTEGSNPSRSAINPLKLFLFFPNYRLFLAAKDSNPPGFASADISRVNCSLTVAFSPGATRLAPSRSAINLLKLFLFFPNYISFLAAKDSSPPGFASADISRVNCDRELDARHLRALSFGERAAETGDHFLRGSHGSRARSGLKEIEINSIF